MCTIHKGPWATAVGIIDDPYAQYFYFGASLVNLLGHSAGKWMFDLIMPGAHEMLIARLGTVVQQGVLLRDAACCEFEKFQSSLLAGQKENWGVKTWTKPGSVVTFGLLTLCPELRILGTKDAWASLYNSHLPWIWTCRTRCIDDLVLQEVKDGVTQVVVLGAGYDMRSVRLGLEAKVKFFEARCFL